MKTKIFLTVLGGYMFFHTIYPQCNNLQGNRSGGTVGQNTTVGNFGWSSPLNVMVSDNNYASVGVLLAILGTGDTYYITVQDFGFTIPLTANICGIEARVEHRGLGLLIGSNINDNAVRIIKNGVITGNNLGSSATWVGTNQVGVYGGLGDTWGTTWNVADINSSTFGIAISAHLSAGLASLFLTAQIDEVEMGVYYENPLPVELMSFNANTTENREINLQWSTASETNNAYFILERSTDAIVWEDMVHVQGMGNNNVLAEYNFSDNAPLMQGGYYRLSQVDFDGSRNELGIRYAQYLAPDEIEIGYDDSQKEIKIFTNQMLDELSVEIFDMKGNAVKNITYQQPNAIIHIPASDLQSQMYFLVMDIKGNDIVKKVMVY